MAPKVTNNYLGEINQLKGIGYRPDIDGLRAVAVLSVVIFHLEPNSITGGFLGVDIFFVISGFLITNFIYCERLEQNFTFANFYARRAKRILPPLFLLLSLVLIVGYFVSLPYDYYKIGISTLSVLVFASNMQYALRTGDYFSTDSSEWPLLHTWSLAVEEQYYFAFPITLFLLLKFFNHHKLLILVVLCLASFMLAEYMSRTSGLRSISYYLIITRFGELLVGSLLALLSVDGRLSRFQSNSLAIASLLIVVTLLYWVDDTTPFPGFIALAICLPIAVLIHSKHTIVNKFLANRLFVFTGLISYSLYLFHWPVLAYIRYVFNIHDDEYSIPFNIQIYAVTAIVFLSLGSFYFVEKPLRRLKLKPLAVAVYFFAIPTLLLGLLASYVVINKGIPDRLSTDTVKAELQYSHIDKNKCPDLVNIGCKGGRSDSNKKIVLYGNSHAEHYFEYVSILANEFNYEVELYSSGGCKISKEKLSKKCQHVYESFENAKDSADIIFLAYRLDYSAIGYEELLSSLASEGHRVVVMAQPPLLNVNPSKISNCIRLGVFCGQEITFSDKYPRYNNVVRDMTKKHGAEYLDPYTFVSDYKKYRDGNILFYSDDDHLSVYGAQWLAKQFPRTSPPIFTQ